SSRESRTLTWTIIERTCSSTLFSIRAVRAPSSLWSLRLRAFASLRDLRNNLRVMRKSRALATLFPTLRGELLAATLTRPDKWWYLSELAAYLQTTPSSLQRELKALGSGVMLQQRRYGTRMHFTAETRSALFPELRRLVEKTAGLLPTLAWTLEPFRSRIDCAFVYGSVARTEEHALSDVDLMIIGDVGVADLAPALRKAEGQLGREISVTSYSAREFRKKAAAKDHFLTEVLHGPKEFVQGNQGDLDEIVGRQCPAASGVTGEILDPGSSERRSEIVAPQRISSMR